MSTPHHPIIFSSTISSSIISFPQLHPVSSPSSLISSLHHFHSSTNSTFHHPIMATLHHLILHHHHPPSSPASMMSSLHHIYSPACPPSIISFHHLLPPSSHLHPPSSPPSIIYILRDRPTAPRTGQAPTLIHLSLMLIIQISSFAPCVSTSPLKPL